MNTKLPMLAIGCLALVSATAGGHAILPANVVENGGFESDTFDPWEPWGHSVEHSGCNTVSLFDTEDPLRGQAALVEDNEAACYLRQIVDGQTPTAAAVLDVSARIVDGAEDPGHQNVRVAANRDASGQGENTVQLRFQGGEVGLRVYCNTDTGAGCGDGEFSTVPWPSDGQWHHYQVVLLGSSGTGILLIDGVYATDDAGDPGAISTPDEILIGDTAGHDGGNPAPTMAFDDVYFGPAA